MRERFITVKYGLGSLILLGVLGLGSQTVLAEPGVEKEPCTARVPADQLAEAKASKSPIAASADVIAEGKAIFEGKGTCFTCHGLDGKGSGDAGKALDPGPRNFTNTAFHDCKSVGEMFWVVKNGSPGTGMIPAVITGILTEEEAWKTILYEKTFKGK
jgi:mono/diheme cytochrome c family protein